MTLIQLTNTVKKSFTSLFRPNIYLTTHIKDNPVMTSYISHSELLNEYRIYRESTGVLNRTITDDCAKIAKVLNLIGKSDIRNIRAIDADRVKGLLSKLPSNVHKKHDFANLSLKECVIKNQELQEPSLSISTVKDYIQKTSSFWSWCIRYEYTDLNPFHRLKLKDRTRKANSRRPALTDHHLTKLFTLKQYITGHAKQPYHYWLLLLLRYTGMRLNEACQLYRDDIILHDGIYCIRVACEFEGQKVKNANALRSIPVATALIKAGFISFASNITSGSRLFPELPFSNDSYGSNASKWAATQRKKLEFEQGYDLHSMRHRFINELKNHEIAESLVAAICGHHNDAITYNVYGKDYAPSRLLEIVDMIDSSFTDHIANYQPK